MLFDRKFKIKKDMIPNIRPTSKVALKQTCLYMANGDLEKAERLYDYMIKDMDDLPTFDIPEPTRMQQVKQGVSETMHWMKDNQDQIFIWVDLLQGFFRNKRNSGDTQNVSSNPIPSINK